MSNRFRGARFALALLIGLLASPALADDLVVMPFSCAVVDGKPVLTQSDEHGHRVIGAREQRKILTCSTVDPKRCRQWTAFKFDMDCGGQRVAWKDVFANASEHTRRRVWERNGRLRVQNTTARNQRLDDICARRMGPNFEWSSTSALCDEVSPANSPTSTDMPVGFAPMVGLDAVIMRDDVDRPMQRAAAAKPSTRPSVQPTPTATKPVAAKQQPVNVHPDARGASKHAEASKPVVVPTPTAASKAPTPSAAPAEQARPLVAVPETVASVAAPTVPVTSAVDATGPPPSAAPLIAEPTQPTPAGPAEATVAETPPASEVTPPTQAMRHGEETTGSITHLRRTEPATAPSSPPQQLAEAKPEEPSPEALPEPTSVVEVAPTVSVATSEETDRTLAYAIAAFATAALIMIGLVVNWLSRAQSNPPEREAVGELPIAGGHDVTPKGTSLALQAERSAQLVTVAATPTTVAVKSGWIGDRIPTSRREALDILGMGVASDGNLTSLKKIIDGLRMNWHPDQALDEADRRTRELRLKQINAAWEILGGKTAEA